MKFLVNVISHCAGMLKTWRWTKVVYYATDTPING